MKEWARRKKPLPRTLHGTGEDISTLEMISICLNIDNVSRITFKITLLGLRSIILPLLEMLAIVSFIVSARCGGSFVCQRDNVVVIFQDLLCHLYSCRNACLANMSVSLFSYISYMITMFWQVL